MKKLILFLITLILFSCSKSEHEDCNWYFAVIGDTCDCTIQDESCKVNIDVTREENLRLEELMEEATEPCLYVESYSRYTGDVFGGYLLSLRSDPCPKLDW